jgi:hypothetical protein
MARPKKTDAPNLGESHDLTAGLIERLTYPTGKHQAARALMMFRGFLPWCAARPEYRKLIDRDAGKAPAILENLPSNTKRTDAIESAQLLATLPRINAFVFASASKAGRISDTRSSHAKALQSAGIDGLTIHGLRRSFSLLGESAGAPAGAIAQVMGHKPSATAEGYRPRSVDALRPYLEKIEAHILEQAGVTFDAKAEPGKLHVVAG